MSGTPLLAVAIHQEQDVVLARQRARQVADQLGVGAQDAIRLATAVSEIARNAWEYTRGGRVEFSVDGEPGRQRLVVRVTDRGPGIPHLADVLAGAYRSPNGMGLGIVGARRLVADFAIEAPAEGGTRVSLAKYLPRSAPLDAAAAARVADALARDRPRDPVQEALQQNHELVAALGELQTRQEEMVRLNGELEDTNRGVVALYAELEDRANELRRANEVRAQFLYYMSHEFRTPLDSMISLSALLLDRVDGELTPEQERQVEYLRRSARDLLQMTDDLLDTARLDAGQVTLRPATFNVGDLFNALRATFRPLSANGAVALEFEDAVGPVPLRTDEGKLSQILRNFVSNALKFTAAGEVRVRAAAAELDGRPAVEFSVADTGMGIAPDDLPRVWLDYTQVEAAHQRRQRGTGLGLPLSARLAGVLGGRVGADSTVGRGSRFWVTIPTELPADAAALPAAQP